MFSSIDWNSYGVLRGPFGSNLFLDHNKRKSLLLTQKGDLRKARFTDDLCTKKNEFENNYKDIFPDELVLK